MTTSQHSVIFQTIGEGFVAAMVYLGVVRAYFSDLKTDIRKLGRAILELPGQIETLKSLQPGAPETAKIEFDRFIATLRVIVDETEKLETEFELDGLEKPRKELADIANNVAKWTIDTFARDTDIGTQIVSLADKIKQVGI